MQKYIVGGIVLLLFATAVFAQGTTPTPTAAGQVLDPLVQEVLNLAKNLIEKIRAGDGLAALGALVTLLTSLVKSPWGQMILAKIIRAGSEWELKKQQKILLAFVFACIVAYFTVPGDSAIKVIGRAVNIALCAVGVHQVARNFLYSKGDEDAE